MAQTIHPTDLTTAAGRADAQRRVHAALAFAHGASGRATLLVRRAIGMLGPFGTVILALYPVALAVALLLAGFRFTAHTV